MKGTTNMALVGIKLVTLALLGDDDTILTGENGLSENGLYPVTTEVLGTKSANITNISGTPTAIYGNDAQVDADIPGGTPSVALDFNGLPVAVKYKALGRVNDGKGGYVQGNVPRVAMLIKTTEVKSGNPQYIAFAKGVMNETALNLQTNTNAVTRVDDAPTYTAFGVTRWDDEAIKFFDGGDKNFTEEGMKADVFNGYQAQPTTTTTQP